MQNVDAPSPTRIPGRFQGGRRARGRGPKGAGALSQALPSSGCARALLSLGLFPDRQWRVRELMREANLSSSQVATELDRLERLGVVERHQAAGGVCYTLKTQGAPWRSAFTVLRCYATPTEVLKHALAPLAARIAHARLFGSFARGAQREDSDVDVLVVGNDLNRQAVTANCLAASHLLGRDVNPVVFSTREWDDMVVAGHPFAASVLGSPSIPVTEGVAA